MFGGHLRETDEGPYLFVEWFEWTRGGRTVYFSVDHMRFEAMRWKVKPRGIALGDKFVEEMIRRSGVEERRLREQEDDKLFEPGIVLEWSNGTHIVADGNHRMVRAYRMGAKMFPCFILTKSMWSNCLITHPINDGGRRVPNVPDICPETEDET